LFEGGNGSGDRKRIHMFLVTKRGVVVDVPTGLEKG
jgi:hypothetical protein